MHRSEQAEIVSSAACGAEVFVRSDRVFTFGTESALCWERSVRRGGWFRSAELAATAPRWVALAIVLGALLLGAVPAGALTISGLGGVEPAYFNPKNTTGLAPGQGLSPDFSISPDIPQIRICNLASAACTNPDISVTQTLSTIYQRPQTTGDTPSLSIPYVADVIFTLERITTPKSSCSDGEGCGPIDPILLTFAAFTDPYVGAPPVALDLGSAGGLTPLLLMERLTGGTLKLFPVNKLPGLNVGEQTQFTVRYVIGGAMQPNALGGYDLPPIALTGFEVPEPSTALLLLAGLVAVAFQAARRSNRW